MKFQDESRRKLEIRRRLAAFQNSEFIILQVPSNMNSVNSCPQMSPSKFYLTNLLKSYMFFYINLKLMSHLEVSKRKLEKMRENTGTLLIFSL